MNRFNKKLKKLIGNKELKKRKKEIKVLDTLTYNIKGIDLEEYYINLSKEKLYLSTRYNRYKLLSESHYFELARAQEYVCKICLKPETACQNGTIKALSIDHCHETGKVRGLLCGRCNTGLGMFKDDINSLMNAIEYLSQASASFGRKNSD